MLRWTVRMAGTSVTLAVVTLAGTGAANAVGADGRTFGEHVVTCVQEHGFSGSVNPGMHTGFSGWDPHHECGPVPS